MIRAEDVVVDKGPFHPAAFDQIARDEKIIDPPADVPLAGLEAIGPPGVLHGIRIKVPKSVHITAVDDAVQPVPLDA